MENEIPKREEQLFLYVIGTFQSSALVALGKLKSPISKNYEINIEQASFYIDLLSMMQNKMNSNLTEYEEQTLINTISELKLNFIDEKNKTKDKT